MALNLSNTVSDFLKANPEQKFTARQIAEWIFETYPEECRKKQERSKATIMPLVSDKDLIQQIVAEIGSQRPILQRKYPNLKTTEGRPRKYYFTHKTEQDEIIETEDIENNNPNTQTTNEHSLYSILSEYLFSELNVFSKRIDEKRSRNTKGSGGNKWLFPDIVGMEDLTKGWQQETKDFNNQYSKKKTKLWSFEVKLLVNRSNIREVFFQTVSNSSWANFAYLVAADIEGNETMKELRILAGLHGIGFINLDRDNPSDSQILIPAREREEVDWNTINRLVEENKDFAEYIKLIRQFYQTDDVREKDWDFYQS